MARSLRFGYGTDRRRSVAEMGAKLGTMRGYQQAYRNGWLKIRVQMAPGVANVAEAEGLAASGLYILKIQACRSE